MVLLANHLDRSEDRAFGGCLDHAATSLAVHGPADDGCGGNYGGCIERGDRDHHMETTLEVSVASSVVR